jgi:hypothetical protein
MAKNPGDRYATCAEIAAALRGVVASSRSFGPARGSGPVPTAPRPDPEASAPEITVEMDVDFVDPEYSFDDVTVKTESGTVDVTQPMVRPRR